MISDPDELVQGWREWVATNLGTDPVRADAAARKAAGVALEGAGFGAAAAAARESWRTTAPSARPVAAATANMPRAIGLAMAIAIGGCLASAVLALLLGILFAVVSSIAAVYLLYNLGLAGLNVALRAAMRRGSRRAWTAALALLIIGIVFDVVEQTALWQTAAQSPISSPDIAFASLVGAPGLFIEIGVGMPFFLLGIDPTWVSAVVSKWLAIHLLTIQVPILVGLIAGRPARGARPTSAG